MANNLAEEFHDFLDSPTWFAMVEMMKKDVKPRRYTLLTAPVLTDVQRAAHVYTIAAYYGLCKLTYETAGRKLPPELRELFTGDTKEN